MLEDLEIGLSNFLVVVQAWKELAGILDFGWNIEHLITMNALISGLPLGYRFRPTEEELLDYYLKKRIASERIDMDLIRDIDLYKIEPWDLQEIYGEDAREWYVFNKNNKKGGRICRSTAGGRWRDTGHEKEIHSNSDHDLIGRRKTLVFRHKGRSHNAQISEWIMHEYRLETPQANIWHCRKEFEWLTLVQYNNVRRNIEHLITMNALISGLPLGYRFRPTEEELLDYYLKKRIASERIDMDLIRDIDLYKIEPWDLQEIYGEDAREWYVFNKNNKKGSRICRSTAGGYWKETGKDKPIYSKQAGGRHQIGQRKILVFYKGRSSKGQISDYT
ncbi:hypothetical protein SUGI_1035030 [Cryptomeria japonica]|nr:hypothetical protein SUGI_1035030 [Cryptomeria japonica]